MGVDDMGLAAANLTGNAVQGVGERRGGVKGRDRHVSHTDPRERLGKSATARKHSHAVSAGAQKARKLPNVGLRASRIHIVGYHQNFHKRHLFSICKRAAWVY